MTTPLDVLVLLLSWVGVACVVWFLGAHLYSRAVHDAWREDNVDKRVFWGGVLVGCGFCWFVLGPSVLFGSTP